MRDRPAVCAAERCLLLIKGKRAGEARAGRHPACALCSVGHSWGAAAGAAEVGLWHALGRSSDRRPGDSSCLLRKGPRSPVSPCRAKVAAAGDPPQGQGRPVALLQPQRPARTTTRGEDESLTVPQAHIRVHSVPSVSGGSLFFTHRTFNARATRIPLRSVSTLI